MGALLGLLLAALGSAEAAEPSGGHDVTTFMADAQRTGWFAAEDALAPETVASPEFGLRWTSEELDGLADQAGHVQPAHLYAAPLYLDALAVATPAVAGTFRAVIAASSNAWVYAIAAAPAGQRAAGDILWRTALGRPAHATDGGVPIGILGTPVIDRAAGRLYVSAATMPAAAAAAGSGDAHLGWKLFALALADGRVLPGWPVAISDEALARPGIAADGAARMGAQGAVSQRGALALSPDGRLVYVGFGAYSDSAPGWLVAVDTGRAAIAEAFSGGSGRDRMGGGIWSSAGVSLDAAGTVFAVTGNSPAGAKDRPGCWGHSLLMWPQPGPGGFALAGTYTPFNYEAADNVDIDLGSSGAVIVPDLDPALTATPRLAAIAGKQGNVYLVDRAHLPGGLERRPPPSHDSASDRSLLPPGPQPQFQARGPLNVFGPYTDLFGNWNNARSRSTPACFIGPDGARQLIATGTTKAAAASAASVPPSVARLRIVTAPGAPAYLAVEALETTLALSNPGCPVVSSDGGARAVAWVLDAPIRSQPLNGGKTPRPVLYAFDAMTLEPLWRTGETTLGQGGKYTAPTIARGLVLVGTDRVYAFGLRGR